MDNGYRQLSYHCLNADVASRLSLERFENVRFDQAQLAIAAARGKAHEFRFRTRLLGSIVALDAFELRGLERPQDVSSRFSGNRTATLHPPRFAV